MTRRKEIPRYQKFAITNGFLEGLAPATVARNVNRRYPGLAATAQSIYRLIQSEAKDGRFRSIPTISDHYIGEVSGRFGFSPAMIEVTESEEVLDAVAYKAAESILAYIQKKAKKKRRAAVHLGFGSGVTCQLVASYLARMLRIVRPLPPLVFHALTPGFDNENPFNAPNSYFHCFKNLGKGVKVDVIGFHARPLVADHELDEARACPIASSAFAARGDIDLIVTAFASYRDPHGELQRLVRLGVLDAEHLAELGSIGDVQFCPFGEKGPIEPREGRRPMTLFRLDELRRFAAQPGKDVMLVGGPCGACKAPRTDALRVLMTEPSLRVWTHIVTDEGTCRVLLEEQAELDARAALEKAKQKPAAGPGPKPAATGPGNGPQRRAKGGATRNANKPARAGARKPRRARRADASPPS